MDLLFSICVALTFVTVSFPVEGAIITMPRADTFNETDMPWDEDSDWSPEDDEMDDDTVELDESEDERSFSNRDLELRIQPPAKLCVRVRVIFNRAWVISVTKKQWRAWYYYWNHSWYWRPNDRDVKAAKKAAEDAFKQARHFYRNLPGLGTKIYLSLEGGKARYEDSKSDDWYYLHSSAQQLDSAILRDWIVEKDNAPIDHYAFLVGENDFGTHGHAKPSTVCMKRKNDQKKKVTITEFKDAGSDSMEETGSVLSHEIGHALGMEHDFVRRSSSNRYGKRYDSKGKRCGSKRNEYNNVMSYIWKLRESERFSSCSKEDFTKFYSKWKGLEDKCMTC